MSQYENYDDTSKDYDKGRYATGLEVILGAFAVAAKRNLKELHILDAGCGTGNFAVALSDYVGKVTGVDNSSGMLEQARRKTSTLSNVEVVQGNITNLQFGDDSFDGIICIQVLHHLQPLGVEGYECVGKFMREAYRVLKPGGVLVVETSLLSAELCSSALWTADIVPHAVARLAKRYPPLPELSKLMKQTGFKQIRTYSHLEQDPPAVFLNKEGPFDPQWRNMISLWALATPEELQAGLEMWRKMIDEGKADDHIARTLCNWVGSDSGCLCCGCHKRNLKELHILDAGCGTGNFAVALSDHVGKVTGVDHSSGMLEQARRKTSTLSNVEVVQGNITNLQFGDDSFDGIICIHVLHHLQPLGVEGYECVGKFMREAYRVLKPGGVLVVDTFLLSAELCSSVLWTADIVPHAVARLVKRYPPLPELSKLMKQTGFKHIRTYSHLEQDPPAVFLNKEGPFDPQWRNMISLWALATPEELQAGLERWRKMIDEEKADDHIARCEEKRKQTGIFCTVIAFMPQI